MRFTNPKVFKFELKKSLIKAISLDELLNDEMDENVLEKLKDVVGSFIFHLPFGYFFEGEEEHLKENVDEFVEFLIEHKLYEFEYKVEVEALGNMCLGIIIKIPSKNLEFIVTPFGYA